MNVLHDDMMMPKVCKRYDVGFKINNIQKNPQLISILEPWCDTLYTDVSNSIKDSYIQNEENISHFKIKDKLKPLNPIEGYKNDILIEFDALFFGNEQYKFVEDLMFIIEHTPEVGIYEFNGFTITINTLNSYEDKLINADDSWYLNKLKV